MLIELIADEIGLPASLVSAIVATAPHRYKVYEVDKKSGQGKRTIAQPAKEVKLIQRFVVTEVINDLPVHDAASAYRKERGIRHNAEAHINNKFLLKMDFEDFFPSLRPNHLLQHIEKYLPNKFQQKDLEVICRVCFWKPREREGLRLSIGGPSSPFISNTLMYDFDSQITDIVPSKGVAYTRYADDLTFSTNQPDVLKDIERVVQKAVKTLRYPKVSINGAKTIHTSKKHHRKVTGLVLSSQGKVSLGRERKRQISAMVHHAIAGDLNVEEKARLKGLLAFSHDVEPAFVTRLKKKYGNKEMTKLLK